MTDEASRRRHLRQLDKELLVDQIITDDLIIKILDDTVQMLKGHLYRFKAEAEAINGPMNEIEFFEYLESLESNDA